MHARLFYIFFFFLFSCNNNTSVSKEILAEFDSVNKSLDQTNNLVGDSGTQLKKKLQSLADTDPAKWKKIVELDSATGVFYDYCDSLSRAFVTFCGTDASGSIAPEAEDNISLSTQYFIDQGNGRAFYQRVGVLSERGAAIALTDSTRSFAEELVSVPSTITRGPLPPSPDRFTNAYFRQVPPVAVLTILARFKSDAQLLRIIIFDEYSKLVSSQP